MTVGELIEALKKYPPQAMLVFEDASEDKHSYDDVEIVFTRDGEVIIRTV